VNRKVNEDRLFPGDQSPAQSTARRRATRPEPRASTPQGNPPAAAGRFVLVALERGIDRVGSRRGASRGGGRPASRPEVETESATSAAALGAGRTHRDDGSLTYADGGLELRVGERVSVPLGRVGVEGIVIAAGGSELLGDVPSEKIKPVASRLDAAIAPALVELARWIASYYVCPIGMVLATMTPASVKRGVGSRDETRYEFVAEHARTIVPVDVVADVPTDAAEKKRKSTKPLKPSAQARAVAALSALPRERFPLTRDELKAVLGGTLRGVSALMAKGALRSVRRAVVRASGSGSEAELATRSGSAAHASFDRAPSVGHELTDAQRAAVDGIGTGLGSFSTHLLHGVTGSGKTEVYLQLIARVLAMGKTAIVLVPEIALTPQAAARFTNRFGRVAVLHSGLSASARHAAWRSAAEGRARVVVGARSAIFAPIADLGVIIVDEEHDSSYKQDQLPRYHARDVAIRRGQLEACPVVLGSATPALESWRNATRGAFKLWSLPERVGGGSMPRVEIVGVMDERRARLERGGAESTGNSMMTRSPLIGPTLERALGDTLRAGGQAIVLLNRRGYAHFVGCSSRTCGWVLTCDDCDAAMVFHKSTATTRGGWVACHHCLARKIRPHSCPLCGKPVVSLGMGTQRVEEELVARFGASHGLSEGTTLVRVDSDTMSSSRDYFDVLSRFGAGEIRVMVGTQMIAKGLDYPNVRVVGVVLADASLAIPDFRAAERTFQLVSQVAGRAGRGEHAGRVIVQALQPTAPSIVLAARHEYVTFATRELQTRERAGLPPATRMARIVSRDEDEQKAWGRAQAIHAALAVAIQAEATASDVRLSEPAVCPIARIAKHHRVAVDVIAPTALVLNRILTAARSAGVLKSDGVTAVDVDPVALL
jgi:primosomal protein N' (replication factor Y) (superfamily II helicase)